MAKIDDFPWQLSLKYENAHICGASILNARRALTAAHCFSQREFIENFLVTAGSTATTHWNPENNVKLLKFVTHPQFVNVTGPADIAVMWLEKDLVFSPYVQPIRLPEQNEAIVHGTTVRVAGWGYTSDEYLFPGISRNLKSITINVISNEQCNLLYEGKVSSDMLCASSENCEKGARMGDSGGALVVDDNQPTQVGVVAWGRQNMHRKYPGVYIRVASYVNWINSVM